MTINDDAPLRVCRSVAYGSFVALKNSGSIFRRGTVEAATNAGLTVWDEGLAPVAEAIYRELKSHEIIPLPKAKALG